MRRLLIAIALGTSMFAYGQTATEEAQQTATPEQVAQLTAGRDAALAWLGLLDQENYRQSLVDSSAILRSTNTVEQWNAVMRKIRQPLGRAVKRELIDGNFSIDPPGAPAGLYIWAKFNTTFSNGQARVETVILRYEEGIWRVLSYQN